jgi:hypothetical protein
VLLLFQMSFYDVINIFFFRLKIYFVIRPIMNWYVASISILVWFHNIDILGRNNLNIIDSTELKQLYYSFFPEIYEIVYN